MAEREHTEVEIEVSTEVVEASTEVVEVSIEASFEAIAALVSKAEISVAIRAERMFALWPKEWDAGGWAGTWCLLGTALSRELFAPRAAGGGLVGDPA